MRIVNTIRSLQRLARSWQHSGQAIGFVPTMGYLHSGHVSLIHRARREVGSQGIVVVSIYVNPTQFSPSEDLSRYPRDFTRDRRLCREAGADFLFFPSDAQMYPQRDSGDYSTYVAEERLSQGMEGVARPTHFRGVTTVVAKLFNIVLPQVAVFGAKDFQQAAVIKRMVKDLNFPVRIVVAPTAREADGLAMSSRNAYLSPEQRRQAPCLWEAIRTARREVVKAQGKLRAKSLISRLTRELEAHSEARVDYLAFFDPATLQPVDRIEHGVQFALAVFLGKTRLIDNGRL